MHQQQLCRLQCSSSPWKPAPSSGDSASGQSARFELKGFPRTNRTWLRCLASSSLCCAAFLRCHALSCVVLRCPALVSCVVVHCLASERQSVFLHRLAMSCCVVKLGTDVECFSGTHHTTSFAHCPHAKHMISLKRSLLETQLQAPCTRVEGAATWTKRS
jgi:hypothetical protein